VVKNQPSNAVDEGLIPGLGTKIPHAVECLLLVKDGRLQTGHSGDGTY